MRDILERVDLPDMQKGDWKIEKFVVDHIDFSIITSGRMHPEKGQVYTRLTRNNHVVMSDTPAEMYDHLEAVQRAKGTCLLNGLGLGMVLKNILKKPEVTKVIVVEISQDVIDMVSPYYNDPRVEFICADALEYQPPKGIRFQMVWHDIWDDICEDNCETMSKLHRKYGKKADWQGSWGRYEIQRMKRADRLWRAW